MCFLWDNNDSLCCTWMQSCATDSAIWSQCSSTHRHQLLEKNSHHWKKNLSDSVARATPPSLSPHHPFTTYLPVRSVPTTMRIVSRDCAVYSLACITSLALIARVWFRGVERGGDLIVVARRSEPLQLWMNFWFEQTERRSAECTDNNTLNGEEPRTCFFFFWCECWLEFITAGSFCLYRPVTVYKRRWLTSDSVIFPFKISHKVEMNKGECALSSAALHAWHIH